MPQLKVEYARSGRAKCSLTSCKKPVAKHEVRIGTVMELPFGDGVETVKWRHVCCFTDRQIKNAEASGDLSKIEGYEDLAPRDKELVDEMCRGELIGRADLIGRVGDVSNSPLASELVATAKTKAAKKKEAAEDDDGGAKKPQKRSRTTKAKKDAQDADRVDSDATEEYEIEVRGVETKPKCPYGANCFRTSADHFAQFSHDDGTPGDATASSGASLRPVVVGKKAPKTE